MQQLFDEGQRNGFGQQQRLFELGSDAAERTAVDAALVFQIAAKGFERGELAPDGARLKALVQMRDVGEDRLSRQRFATLLGEGQKLRQIDAVGLEAFCVQTLLIMAGVQVEPDLGRQTVHADHSFARYEKLIPSLDGICKAMRSGAAGSKAQKNRQHLLSVAVDLWGV